MPVYEIRTKDGTPVEVEGPPNATWEQLASIYSKQQEYRKIFGSPEITDPGLGDYLASFGRGTASGAVNLFEQAALGAITPLGEETELAARENIQDFFGGINPTARPGMEDTVARKFGEALGSFGALGITSLIPYVGVPLAFSTAAASGAGEASERARAGGASQEERNLATLGGAGVGMTEMYPIRFLKVLKPGDRIGLLDRTKRALASGGVEGAQEVVAGALQNAIEKGVYNPEQELFVMGEVKDQATYGGAVGALVQGVLDLAIRNRGKTSSEVSNEIENTPTSTPSTSYKTQGELFPTSDLGRQGELFAGQNLGRPPETDSNIARQEELARLREQGQQELDLGDRPTTTPSDAPASVQGNLFSYAIEQEGAKAARNQITEDQLKKSEELRQLIERTEAGPDNQMKGPMLQKLQAQKEQLDKNLLPEGKQEQQFREAERARDNQFLDQASDLGIVNNLSQPELQGIIDKKLREKNVNPNINKRTDGVSTKDSGQDAVSTGDIGIDSKGVKAPASDGLGNIRGDIRPDNVTEKQRDDSLTKRLNQYSPRLNATELSNVAKVNPDERKRLTNETNEIFNALGLSIDPERFGKDIDNYINETEQSLPLIYNIGKQKEETVFSPYIKQQEELVAKGKATDKEAKKLGINQTLSKQAFKAFMGRTTEDGKKSKQERDEYQKDKNLKALKEAGEGRKAVEQEDLQRQATRKAKYEAKKRLNQAWEVKKKKSRKVVQDKIDRAKALHAEIQKNTTTSDPSTASDINKVSLLLLTDSSKVPVYAKEAYMYFWKAPDVGTVLEMIAADIVANKKSFRESGVKDKAVREHYSGRSTQAARKAKEWIRSKLSKNSLEYINKRIIKEKEVDLKQLNLNAQRNKAEDFTKKANESVLDNIALSARIKEQKAKGKATLDKINQEYIDKDVLKLPENAVERLDLPLDPFVKQAIRNGNINLALEGISASTESPALQKLASRLTSKTGNTKLVLSETIKESGNFNPKTNTITLNSRTGINLHTFLHELTHAVTAASVADRSNPVSKQVNTLYNSVKDQLGTYYGSQNVDEFVAEAMSNPTFQDHLRRITPKGETLSAWQRFKNIVGNILRKLGLYPPKDLKDTSTVLSEVDRMFDGLLAVAPEYRDADVLRMDQGKKGLIDVIDYTQKVAKGEKLTSEYRKKWVSETVSILPSYAPNVGKKFMGFLPLLSVVDIGNYVGLEGAKTTDTLIREQEGKGVGRRVELVDGTIKRMVDLVPRNNQDAFNKIIAVSTRNGVDPELSLSRATDKYGSDNEKMKDWKEVKEMWNSLPTNSKKAYTLLRNLYQTQYEDLKNNILKRAEDLGLDTKQRQSIKEKLFKNLLDKSVDPYFPLTRTGNKWLAFDKAGETIVMSFEGELQRKRAIRALKDQGITNVRLHEKDSAFRVFGQPGSNSFMLKILETLKNNKVDNKIQDELLQMFVQALPETSFAKAFAKREGTLGFNLDAIYALKTKGYDMARTLGKMEYAHLLRKEEDRLTPFAEQADMKGTVAKELIDRIQFARNPPPDAPAILANRVAFNFTLGFNISSAVVNLSQIPLMFMPMLGGKYGFAESNYALTRAMKLFTNSGFKRSISLSDGTSVKTGASPSIDNYYVLDRDGNYKVSEEVKNNKKYPPEFIKELESLTKLVQVAQDQGQLNRSIFHDTLALEGESRGKGFFEKLNIMSASVFHQVERFNRQVALISSYKLELDRLNSDRATPSEQALSLAQRQEMAANNAVYETQMINGGALLGTAPRLAQQSVGRVALMYKGFGIQMYYTMLKTALKGLTGTPAEKKIAAKQITGILLSSFTLSGVVGMPLVGALMSITNLFLDDEDEDAQTLLRQYLQENIYKGPLTAITGVDVSGRIGLSNLLFRANPYVQEWDVKTIVMEGLGGPAGSTAEQLLRGAKEMFSDDPNKKPIETMTPAAIKNVLKTFRYVKEDGAYTRRDDLIVGDFTNTELFGQLMGFSPARYTFTQEKNRAKKNMSKALNEKTSKLLKHYYLAYRMGDYEEMSNIMNQMLKRNAKRPEFAITYEALMRSMKSHMRTTANTVNGIYLPPNQMAYFSILFDDFQFE